MVPRAHLKIRNQAEKLALASCAACSSVTWWVCRKQSMITHKNLRPWSSDPADVAEQWKNLWGKCKKVSTNWNKSWKCSGRLPVTNTSRGNSGYWVQVLVTMPQKALLLIVPLLYWPFPSAAMPWLRHPSGHSVTPQICCAVVANTFHFTLRQAAMQQQQCF